jgi:hypothetical protein
MSSLSMSPELAAVADQLVDANRPPSHDELRLVFRRAGVSAADPADGKSTVGKVKRVRAVASWCAANDPVKGGRLFEELVGAVRAEGGFATNSEAFIGNEVLDNLRRVLQAVGYTLDADGTLAPLLLDNVPEVERDATLAQYAKRLRRGAADSPLVTGTGKDLLEASARHVLTKSGQGYDERAGLPHTLMNAYTTLGLTPPPGSLVLGETLDPNPAAQIEQAVFLLGVAVNRLRNAEGTGHGRPYPSTVTPRQAELATQAIALASELLLRPR